MSSDVKNAHPDSALKPFISNPNQPVFDELWQAQVLALANLLVESGRIDNRQWSQSLGKQLNKIQSEDNDTMQGYYTAVLAALTELLSGSELLSSGEINQREVRWKQAYLSTPHGRPVELNIK